MRIQYLILIPMIGLAVGKVLLQGVISRNYLKNPTDSALYNLIIFSSMAVLYFIFGGFRLPTLHILSYGIPYGLLIAGFQIFYTLALQRGPVSHTVLIVTFNIAFAISFGVLYCGEEITMLHIIGLTCIFLSLLLTIDFKQAKQHKFDLIWFLESVLAMSMNGIASIVVKLQKLTYPEEDMGMLLAAYVSGACALFLIIRYFTVVRKQPKMLALNSSRLMMILSCSVLLGCYLLLFSIGVGTISSVGFFPVVNIAPSTLLSLLGILVFKDHLTRHQVISMLFGIAATVLLCL